MDNLDYIEEALRNDYNISEEDIKTSIKSLEILLYKLKLRQLGER